MMIHAILHNLLLEMILNGVNMIAIELENNVVGTTQTSQPSDTNEVFIQRCVNQKPPDATHLLVTIKLPAITTQQNLNDLNGIMETTIPDGEGECKYYDFSGIVLSETAQTETRFSRNENLTAETETILYYLLLIPK